MLYISWKKWRGTFVVTFIRTLNIVYSLKKNEPFYDSCNMSLVSLKLATVLSLTCAPLKITSQCPIFKLPLKFRLWSREHCILLSEVIRICISLFLCTGWLWLAVEMPWIQWRSLPLNVLALLVLSMNTCWLVVCDYGTLLCVLSCVWWYVGRPLNCTIGVSHSFQRWPADVFCRSHLVLS